MLNIPLFAQSSACGEMIEIKYELNYPIVTKAPGVVKSFLHALGSDSTNYNLQENDIIKGIEYTDPVTATTIEHFFLKNFDLCTLDGWVSEDAPLKAIVVRDGSVETVICSIDELKRIHTNYSYTTKPVPILSYDSANLTFNFINPLKLSSDLINSSEVLLLDNPLKPHASSVSIGKISDSNFDICTTHLISANLANHLNKDYTHLDSNKVYLSLKDPKSHDVGYFEVKLFKDYWGTEINTIDKYTKKLIANLGYNSIEGTPVLKGSEFIGYVKVHDNFISSPKLKLVMIEGQ